MIGTVKQAVLLHIMEFKLPLLLQSPTFTLPNLFGKPLRVWVVTRSFVQIFLVLEVWMLGIPSVITLQRVSHFLLAAGVRLTGNSGNVLGQFASNVSPNWWNCTRNLGQIFFDEHKLSKFISGSWRSWEKALYYGIIRLPTPCRSYTSQSPPP